IISSNKGLCGAYNVNVQKTAQRYIKAHEGKEISVIAIGKYSEKAARALKANLKASFIDIGEEPHWNDTKVVADLIQEEFVKGEYEEVVVVYTKFISALSYTPVIQQLLPMRKKIFADFQETVGSEKSHVENVKREQVHEYLFEPSEDELLDAVLPRLVESQLYQAVLEARASEHSARMFAMRNASDNAGTLVKDLTLSYNRVRQSAITQELSEIVAGADAL
ncbi:MAG: ATP synthase F1 subunit gamma, partial [Parcubacteria group bacterium]